MATAFHGSTAALRPTGIGRYFAAAFLLVWLTGWAAGEVFALVFLGLLLRSVVGAAAGMSWPIPGGDWITGGAAGFVLLFLLVWLTLWTVGGVAAITHLLRSLAGEDRIDVQSGGVELRRRAGPFGRTRRFDRSQIRGVRLRRHDQAVVLDTASGSELLTDYGSTDERRAMAEWLRARLLLPATSARVDPSAPPPGWRMSSEGGTTRLTQHDPRARAIAAAIMWAIALLLAAILYGAERRTAAGVVIAIVLCALAAAGAIWITFSRRAWLVRHGELTEQTRLLTWERAREFKSARLDVTVSTDSDGDRHYRLEVIDAEGRRRIASEAHDETGIVTLGQWLASRTGFVLRLPHSFT